MVHSIAVPLRSFDPSTVPLPSRRALRVGAVASLTVLLLFVLEGWVPRVPTGAGADRVPAPLAETRPVPAEAGAGALDVADVVERAAHTPLPVDGRAGELEVVDPAYRAAFDDGGFSYAPTGVAAPFRIGLVSVERGGSALPLETGPWTADADAAVRDLAPGLTERVSARTGEVEWDVVLAAPPAGRGDLRVTASLDGTVGAPARTQLDGRPAWRFPLAGGAGAHVDEVVVIDATGAELHRALPRVDDRQLTLDVPSDVLEGAAYPVTVDPTVSSAHPVSPTGFNPSVAFGGGHHLVVWEQPFGGDSDILGARVDASGAVVTGPFLISSSPRDEFHADVAWNGTSFLVVWELREDASTLQDYDVNAQRVSATGALVGEPMVIYGPSSSARRLDQRHPAVAANGVDFFVTWQDNSNYDVLRWDIYGKTVTGNGINGFATRYAEAPVDETFPDVAWNGATYLLVWVHAFSATDSDIHGQRVDPYAGTVLADGTPNGAPLGSNFPIVRPASNQYSVGVASEGFENPACLPCGNPPEIGGPFLVVWGDTRNGSGDTYGGMVDASGNVLDGDGFPIATGPRSQAPGSGTVAFNRETYLVAWLDVADTSPFPRGIYAARLDRGGQVLDPNGFRVVDTSAVEQSPAVWRGSGSEFGVAYETYGASGASIAMNRVNPK